MATEVKTKKPAKMGHTKTHTDTGRKQGIPCGHCGKGDMVWSRVGKSMKWVCPQCGMICEA